MATPRSAEPVRGRPAVVLPVTLALLVTPVLADLLLHGRRLFAWFAADAFYYLQIARNWAESGRISFDQERPTNGFHPLWQWVETALWWSGDRLGLRPVALLAVVLLAGLAALAAALVLLARTLRLSDGRLTPLFLLLPVGLYALLVAPAWLAVGALDPDRRDPFEGGLPLYGTLWSYVNGMETALVVLAWSGTAYVAVRWGLRGIPLGVALSVLVLARLDTVIVAAAIVGVIGLAGLVRRDGRLVRACLVSGTVVVAVVLAYLAWNAWYSGTALPVSATLKSSFPRPALGNWRDLRSLIAGNSLFGPERLYRHAPVLLPAAVAVAYLVSRARVVARADLDGARGRYRLVLVGTAAGVVLLGAYDWFFVPGYHQGHWYWPVSTLFVSLAALDWLSGVHLPVRATAVVAVSLSLVVFATLGRRDDYHERYAAFWYDEAPRARAAYEAKGFEPRLLAIDDGIDSFALGYPAMSGIGLALDREGADAYEQGRLLDVALDRGFDRISSLAYVDVTGLTASSPSDEVRSRLAPVLPGQDLDAFRFAVEYLSEPLPTPWDGNSGRFAVIRVTRR